MTYLLLKITQTWVFFTFAIKSTKTVENLYLISKCCSEVFLLSSNYQKNMPISNSRCNLDFFSLEYIFSLFECDLNPFIYADFTAKMSAFLVQADLFGCTNVSLKGLVA